MAVIEKYSPVTGEKLGDFPICSPAEVGEAVARARAAFGPWRDRGLASRLEVLGRMRAVLLQHGEDYARRISADTGKPLVDALVTELLAASLFLDHYQKRAPKLLRRHKRPTPLAFQGKKSYLEHFPRGVIGVISPWNFPFFLSVVPVLSALIGGNTVVLKPSEVTPLTGEVIRDLYAAMGLPEGVVEVIQGDGSTGAALVDADIDMVFFTGSVATGRKVMAQAAKKPIPAELELGGKDAMIVCADANLERAARGAAWGGLVNCGQMCISVERIFAVESIHDRFVELLAREVDLIRQGGPEANADVGPMTFPRQIEIVEAHLADAVAKGAQVLRGGTRPAGPGLFFPPTLLTGVTPDMLIYQEETFGPVLPVIRVADEDEAVRLANDHIYGLAGSVWTADRKHGLALASRLECGQVNVNDVVVAVSNPTIPFGGIKSSGIGRYHGDEGLTTFMHARAIMSGKDKLPAEPFWFPYGKKYDAVLRAFQFMLRGKLVSALGPLRVLKKLNLQRGDD